VPHTVDNVERNDHVDACDKGHSYLVTSVCRDRLRLKKTIRRRLTDTMLLARLPPFRRAPPPPAPPEVKRPPRATSITTTKRYVPLVLGMDEKKTKTSVTDEAPPTPSVSSSGDVQKDDIADPVACIRELPPDLPAHEVDRSNSVALGPTYYVFGGCRVESDRVLRYDTRAAIWQTLQPMPRTFMRHAVATTSAGEIVVVGGMSRRTRLNCDRDAYLYAPATDTWQTLPDLPYVVGFHAITVYRDPRDDEERLLVLGGVENPETFPVYRSGLVFGFRTFAWQSFESDMLRCRYRHMVRITSDGALQATGGFCSDSVHGKVTACTENQGERFDFRTRTWSLLPSVDSATASS
jgi:hypothetical protein